MIIVKTFLPVIDAVILQINTIAQNIAFKTGFFFKISGSSAATRFDVTLHLFFTELEEGEQDRFGSKSNINS